MILSDGEILDAIKNNDITISPFHEEYVQPASVDVRLDHRFLVLDTYKHDCTDPYNIDPDAYQSVEHSPNSPFVLHPGEFALGATLEEVGLADNIVARIEGKSSMGRMGLLIHATAGFVDPGWGPATLTLELSNVSRLPILLYPGMFIAQLSFFKMGQDSLRSYGSEALGSHYSHQGIGPVAPSSQTRPADISII